MSAAEEKAESYFSHEQIGSKHALTGSSGGEKRKYPEKFTSVNWLTYMKNYMYVNL